MRSRFTSAVVILLLVSGCARTATAPPPGPQQPAPVVDIGVAEAKRMIDTDPDVIILDVRTREEYDSGHIDRAVLIPVSELERRTGELDRNKRILVYCRSGSRSRTASEILIRQGFLRDNMLGGINAWVEAKYPVVT
ncbi:MAG: rhodanese-like domain-containing protein [Chloroflexota bacterium]